MYRVLYNLLITLVEITIIYYLLYSWSVNNILNNLDETGQNLIKTFFFFDKAGTVKSF